MGYTRKNRPWMIVAIVLAFIAACVLLVLLSRLQNASREQTRRAAATSLPAGAPSRIVVADDFSYAPFSFPDLNGRPAGITVDIWKLWSKKTGVEVDFRLMEWSRALAAVQNGEADAIGSMIRTGQREKSFAFSKAFFSVPVGIFFHEQIRGIRGIEDLQGFPIGIVTGDISEELILKRYPKTLFLRYPGAEDLVRAAVGGAIKVFVSDSDVARFYLAKIDRKNDFRETTRPIFTNSLHATVKKGDVRLLALVEEGFARISKREIEAIADSWTGRPAVSRFPWSSVLLAGGAVAALLALVLLWNINLRKSIANALGAVEQRNRELQESEARFKAFFDLAPFGCVVNDLHGVYRMVNQAFCRRVGLREEEVLGHTGDELGIIADESSSSHFRQELLRTSEVSNREVIVSSSHGPLYALYSSRLLEFGGERLVLSTAVDITERKRAEEALRESENSFIRLFESAPVPMAFASDVDGFRATTWNESWYQTFGYTREEADGRSGADIGLWVDPEDRRRFLDMAEVRSRVKRFEVMLRRRDGVVRQCEVFGCYIGKTGRQVLMVAYLDISERKEAEEAIRESEERFSKAFRLSPAPMVISDIDTGRFIDVNEQWLQMMGHSREEIIGHTSYELGIWDDPGVRTRQGRRLRESGPFKGVPVRFFTRSGETRDVLWSAEIVNLGGTEAMLSLIYDITDRQRMEDALRESESYNKVLFNDSHIALAVLDPVTMQFVDCNNAALAIYGLTDRSQLLGKQPGDFSTPLQYDGQASEILAVEQVEAALKRGLLAFEWRHLRIDGEIWDAEVHLMSFTHRDRTLIQLSLQDITGRKRAEEEKEKLQVQLMQSQKMESVGRLAGGVAHDYNNMLGVILGHAELALLKSDVDHLLHVHLSEIRSAAQRSAELTQQLLAFARRQTIAPRVLDLNESVTATLQMLRLLIGENIELVWLPGTEAYPVKIDPSQFDQLLMNLCVNARDAIDGNGRIDIETERVILDGAYCAANPFFVPGDYAVLIVSDNGCGMDKETMSRIFEPFFTTKGIGQGTGLGLATVYGIVKQNDGFINVYSEPGQGTTFRIYLPRRAGSAVQGREPKNDEVPRGRGETLLVVEDEAVLLDINSTMLVDLGYRVLAAGSPAEALRLGEGHAGAIDLLMTDVVMPEMNGRELERRLQKSNPGIGCLFMSGYTGNVISHHGVLDEGVQFIQKPFTLKDVARKVREVLDRQPADAGGGKA